MLSFPKLRKGEQALIKDQEWLGIPIWGVSFSYQCGHCKAIIDLFLFLLSLHTSLLPPPTPMIKARVPWLLWSEGADIPCWEMVLLIQSDPYYEFEFLFFSGHLLELIFHTYTPPPHTHIKGRFIGKLLSDAFTGPKDWSHESHRREGVGLGRKRTDSHRGRREGERERYELIF